MDKVRRAGDIDDSPPAQPRGAREAVNNAHRAAELGHLRRSTRRDNCIVWAGKQGELVEAVLIGCLVDNVQNETHGRMISLSASAGNSLILVRHGCVRRPCGHAEHRRLRR